MASIEAMRRANIDMGVTSSNNVLIFDGLLDSPPLFLTANTDTVYAFGIPDLKKDGPTVVEIPAGSETVRMKIGGRMQTVFVPKSASYSNWLILRGFLVDGKPDAASKMFRHGLKIYPLSKADHPPKMNFVNGSGKFFNSIHTNDYHFFPEILFLWVVTTNGLSMVAEVVLIWMPAAISFI